MLFRQGACVDRGIIGIEYYVQIYIHLVNISFCIKFKLIIPCSLHFLCVKQLEYILLLYSRVVLVFLKFCKILVSFSSSSCFNIEITYSNVTFCTAWTPSFLEFKWKMYTFYENEHTLEASIVEIFLHQW